MRFGLEFDRGIDERFALFEPDLLWEGHDILHVEIGGDIFAIAKRAVFHKQLARRGREFFICWDVLFEDWAQIDICVF